MELFALVASLTLDVFRMLVPLLTTLVLALISFITLASPTLNLFLPFFLFPAVFYWHIHQKALLPFWLLFLVGLVIDSLAATPLGLTSAVLLIIHYVLDQREVQLNNAGVWELWLIFVAVTVGGLAISWGVVMVLHLSFLDPTALILRGFATVLSYPVVYIVLLPIDRFFLGRHR